MDKLDQMAEAVAGALRGFVTRSLAGVIQRLEAIEARQPEKGEPGQNGKDGRDGKDAIVDYAKIFEEMRVRNELMIDGAVAKAVAAIPRPEDGRDGRDGIPGLPGVKGEDGKDGVSWKEFAVDFDVESRELMITAAVEGGEAVTKRVEIPMLLYRGVWKAGPARTGDCFTYGGSLWACKSSTNNPPPGDAWQLIVRKGKDA